MTMTAAENECGTMRNGAKQIVMSVVAQDANFMLQLVAGWLQEN